MYVPVPMFVPFSPEKIEKWLERARPMWPEGYPESVAYLRTARIDFLKAINSIIERRISTLEKSIEESKVHKERVRVT